MESLCIKFSFHFHKFTFSEDYILRWEYMSPIAEWILPPEGLHSIPKYAGEMRGNQSIGSSFLAACKPFIDILSIISWRNNYSNPVQYFARELKENRNETNIKSNKYV